MLKAELSFQHQHFEVLPAAYLHRVFRTDQTFRTESDSSRVGTRLLSILCRDGFRCDLRTAERCRQTGSECFRIQPGSQRYR